MWKKSPEYQLLLREIDRYNAEFPIGGAALKEFQNSRRAQQSNRQYVLFCPLQWTYIPD
jgi:hypothetical protein